MNTTASQLAPTALLATLGPRLAKMIGDHYSASAVPVSAGHRAKATRCSPNCFRLGLVGLLTKTRIYSIGSLSAWIRIRVYAHFDLPVLAWSALIYPIAPEIRSPLNQYTVLAIQIRN
jgi:hypothetical protein